MVQNLNHIELAVVLDYDQILVALVIGKIFRNYKALLLAGFNPEPLPVTSGFNSALLLPIISGFNTAPLPRLCSHNKTSVPAMSGHSQAPQAFYLIKFVS